MVSILMKSHLSAVSILREKEGMESTVDTTYKVGLSSTHFSATTAEVGIVSTGVFHADHDMLWPSG